MPQFVHSVKKQTYRTDIQKQQAAPRRHTFFTLQELLLVITIMMILLALLFPVFRHLREKAYRSICLNNLRQFAQATHLYAGAFDGYFPTWSEEQNSQQYEFRYFWLLLESYFPSGSVLRYEDRYQGAVKSARKEAIPEKLLCPSALASYNQHLAMLKEDELFDARPTRAGVYSTAMLNYDSHPAAEESAGKQKIADLPSPDRYFILHESGFNDMSDDRTHPYWKLRKRLDGHLSWGHGTYFNVAFLDGHVEGFTRKRRDLSWQSSFTRVLKEIP